MRELKRSRSFYEGESLTEAAKNGLKSRYSTQAREIARYALLIQGTGRPVKKKELCESLNIGTKEASLYIDEADRFLREQFCLNLIPLKSMMFPGNDNLAARDEHVLISRAGRNRTLLAKSYPDQYRKDYGVMLFVIILIVLKDDLVVFDEIYSSFTQSHLHATDIVEASDIEADIDQEDKARITEDLEASLARLEAMRAFKVLNETDPISQEKIKKYQIGPYAQSMIEAKSLLTLVMRLHFPQDKNILHTPEGQEKYKLVRDVISERISNAKFRTSLVQNGGNHI